MTNTSHLFVPGRGSFVTTNESGNFVLNLTKASERRSDVAASTYDPSFHSDVLFAGGYPGLSQKWPQEQIDAIVASDQNEARLMAARFSQMAAVGIQHLVHTQGESNNSIGDVRISIERGLLEPDDFQTADHGITLVTGFMHGLRFRDILAKALDMDPALVNRPHMHDAYGIPRTEFHHADPAIAEIGKEAAAIAINKLVLKDVRPGNLDDLHTAEERFAKFAAKVSH